jgi:hypothetical protein
MCNQSQGFTAPMPELSPAANAILKAFCERYDEICHTGVLHKNWKEHCIAATLSALATRIKGADGIRQDVLDIINELEQFNA